jgi:hypothetical protein
MPIHFEPKTDEQLAEAGLLPDGIYSFKVIDAKDKISQTGNEMILLKLAVYVGEKPHTVYDHLVVTERMEYKIKHFADSVGISEQYEKGVLAAEDCINREGDVKVATEKAEGYSPRNRAVDYIVSEKYAQKDDPIPF